ncbi:MAG: SDR family oxidoreductase [Steroidobacteraceae bacterium]|jgi:NAD(P)-dependent dehydrogenase (short-subunit alcohol dehydrogenase family)|nr:SDR family oxidoreductase [Steroidobacteraceae bacterium]
MTTDDGRELEGRVALITGAAHGLGAQMARRFAGAGARVAIADLDEAAGRALAAELPGATFHRLDVTREAEWLAAWDAIERDIGPLRILVNNAGFYRPNVPLEQMDLALWQKHFAINTDGPFLGCREALRRMKGRDGVVLNIASTAAINGFLNGAAYSASKAALAMLTRIAAKAGGPHGLRVNGLMPGATPTDMLRGNKLPGQSDEQLYTMLTAHHPMGRLATPDDIARAALFLCSDRASFVSGVLLAVDGAAAA